MKVKTSDLTGVALDWAVAKCEWHREEGDWRGTYNAAYSTDWAQGGPLIERETFNLTYDRDWVYDPNNIDPDDEPDNGDRWLAEFIVRGDRCICAYGPTPLIAAMRCYVASKLGEEVEVPDEIA